MVEPPQAQLTHVGLYVTNMDRMTDFYQRLLGMVVTDQGEFLGKYLTFMSRNAGEHHQLVLISGRRAPEDVVLLGQVSFRLADGDLEGLRWFRDTALELGVADVEGRNHGNSWSIYLLDPEGNRLEIYTATPWYVSQPWRVALDLEESDEVIKEQTAKLIDESATWSAVETWQAALAERLGTAAEARG